MNQKNSKLRRFQTPIAIAILLVSMVLMTQATTTINNTGITTPSLDAEYFFWNGVNRTDVLANPTSPYSYIISVSGSTYRMKNGTTGQIDYQSTNKTLVEQYALGNLTSGTVYLMQVQHNSSLTVPTNVMVIEDYQGVLTYRTATMAQHIPACPTNVSGTFTLTNNTTEQTIVTITTTVVQQMTNFYLDMTALTQNCTLRVYITIGAGYVEMTSMTLTVAAGTKGLALKDMVINTNWKLTIQSVVAEGANRTIPYEYFVNVY